MVHLKKDHQSVLPKFLQVQIVPESVNFEHISHLALVFLLLTLNMQFPAGIYRSVILTLTWKGEKKNHKIHSSCN